MDHIMQIVLIGIYQFMLQLWDLLLRAIVIFVYYKLKTYIYYILNLSYICMYVLNKVNIKINNLLISNFSNLLYFSFKIFRLMMSISNFISFYSFNKWIFWLINKLTSIWTPMFCFLLMIYHILWFWIPS
jgi:hypothetical protein